MERLTNVLDRLSVEICWGSDSEERKGEEEEAGRELHFDRWESWFFVCVKECDLACKALNVCECMEIGVKSVVNVVSERKDCVV